MQVTLEQLLRDALDDEDADDEQVKREVDRLVADNAMMHDWLTERDLSGPHGHWDYEDDNTVWVAETSLPDVSVVVEKLLNAVMDRVNDIYVPTGDDYGSRVEFEWNLATRRLLIKPQMYSEESHSTENVGLSEEQATYLNELLLTHHIEHVHLTFDGSGDSGDMTVDEYDFYDGHDTDRDLGIDDQLVDIAENAVKFDWVNNSGGHGTITFISRRDQTTAEISFQAYYRETSLIDDEYHTLTITY